MINISVLVDIIRNSIYESINIIDNIYYIIVSLLILIASGIVLSYRFLIIVNKMNEEFSASINNILLCGEQNTTNPKFRFFDALHFTLMGWIANTIGFGKFGIPTKTVLLRKRGYSTKTALASIAADTAFDVFFAFLILIMAILFIPSIVMINILGICIIVISLIIIILISAKFKNTKWFLFCKNTIQKIDQLAFWHLFILTSIAWILTSISYYFIILSANEYVNPLRVFIIFNFSVVIGMISPIAGGIGAREGLLTFLSAAINITPAKGLAFALIYRLLSMIALFIIFIIIKLNEILYIKR